MNRYEKLSAINILKPIIQRINAGAFEISPDHKIYLPDAIMPERPWISCRIDPTRECGKWLEIYFKYYSIIPKGCRNCWKVCFRPENLRELLAILDLQKEMDLPAKAGCETRPFTGNNGGYASFWYAPLDAGLKGARELCEIIAEKIHTKFGMPREVKVKRGCTEIENYTLKHLNVGSSKWDELAIRLSFDAKEMLLDTVFVSPVIVSNAPRYCDDNTEQLFIDFAFENGDMTYLEFTGGHPHLKPLTYYQDSDHKHHKFKSTWRKHGPDNDKPDNAGDRPQGAGSSIIQSIPD